MTYHTLTPAALDLASIRVRADIAVLARVSAIYARRPGQESTAVFWGEAAKTASVLAELGRRYLARAYLARAGEGG
jgi:hypothetical protein